MATIVGVDLAGSPKRDTGFCVMNSRKGCTATVVHTDEEILERTFSVGPDVVSIDAPLSLPRGRKSLEIPGPPHFRECDLELRRMHIRFFPISLGPMRMLTARGLHLKMLMEMDGLEVIESFPGAVQDMLGMPRKQKGLDALHTALSKNGVKLKDRRDPYGGDELDAVTSALVGLMYHDGNYLAIGDPTEGLMILPGKSGGPKNTGRS